MADIEEILRSKLDAFPLNQTAFKKLEEFTTLLQNESRVINLTTVNEAEDIVIKHYLDSLEAVDLIPEGAKNLLDIGSGAGLPAIPLAVTKEEIRVTLIEAKLKKVEFLRKACGVLALNNVEVCNERAEILAQNVLYRGKFDVVTSRAVASLNQLIELSVPFLKVGGILIAYKAAKAEEEIDKAENALKELGSIIQDTKTFMLDGIYQRSIIVIKKVKETKKEYPRSYKKIKDKPL